MSMPIHRALRRTNECDFSKICHFIVRMYTKHPVDAIQDSQWREHCMPHYVKDVTVMTISQKQAVLANTHQQASRITFHAGLVLHDRP